MNDEVRMTNDDVELNDESGKLGVSYRNERIRHLHFVIPSAFVIRHFSLI
jgi:hypothetical protein